MSQSVCSKCGAKQDEADSFCPVAAGGVHDWTVSHSEASITIQNKPMAGGTGFGSIITVQKGDPCQRCKERPSTTAFSEGGALGYTHGFYQWWCDVCVLTAQLKHAREQAAAIPDLQRRLRNAKRRKS